MLIINNIDIICNRIIYIYTYFLFFIFIFIFFFFLIPLFASSNLLNFINILTASSSGTFPFTS